MADDLDNSLSPLVDPPLGELPPFDEVRRRARYLRTRRWAARGAGVGVAAVAFVAGALALSPTGEQTVRTQNPAALGATGGSVGSGSGGSGGSRGSAVARVGEQPTTTASAAVASHPAPGSEQSTPSASPQQPGGTEPSTPSTTVRTPPPSTAEGRTPTTVPPDTPVSTVVPSPSTTVPGPVGGSPLRVQVTPGATSLHAHQFESAAAFGTQSVAVRFWGGVEPCEVVGRVDVEEDATTVTITVWTGVGPGAERAACIALAQYKELIVGLSAPLGSRTVVDGAA